MKKEILLLKHQDDFIKSNYRHTGLVAGFGSGKSHAGITKTVIKKLMYNSIDVAYYLPTYPLVKDIAFPKFSEILSNLGIPFKLNRSDKEFHLPNGRIILRTMDNPDLIVGYEVGYSLIDEADVLPKDKMQEVYTKIVARNRKALPNGEKNSLDFVSTPEGFKFLYEFFVKKPSPNKLLIKGKTADNPFLPDDYIPSLLETYSDEKILAYLEGEFVNLTSGNVYRNYNRQDNNTRRVVKAGDVLHIGMDFNITKMNAVVHIQEDKKHYAVDEFVNAYDTQELCELIKRKYPNHKIIVYPDSAGSSRSTSGKSDHDIIRSFGFTIRGMVKNPAVKDRVNAMNLAFKNNKQEISYYVNDEQCPNYSEALERQTYKNGEPDKTSGFDHITEAGGYYIYQATGKTITYRVR
ncbi:terminase [Riemerella anatipestifer]|uniref:phage terminase large subunit n=1 Tax=Riemerella anatipestifer TaxID=34085 RepID=UPI00129E3AB2|nr:phage terminase large subunit [Riemerella anatipestifer]MBT0551598.1 phage terminase large subunit [Riemerella anatipestifer]MBT0552717.1 phage terminase large subunit [Riemerella anatipestifer]MCE3023455.1 phage terminase large subunit [Riemerella anatipestifer]MCU7558960.1 phage terminase large subunit [Riemerella anatipestifer]MDY3448119.1 phage terminase large subunit [Riemerella anatipestifer]